MRDLPPTQVYEYACEDADITLRLKNVLEPRLKEAGVESLFRDIEMPLMPVLAEMEMNGVCLDTKALAETSKFFTERMLQLEAHIYELAGEPFNISSPKQVGDILFGKMKIVDKPKKTKTGQFVTSEEVLMQLRSKSPIVGEILDYRGLKKLLSTYVDALPKLINPRTGHIHTSFNQAVTATGRLSSSDPNLQNIPVRGEDGKEIRKCFVPEPNCQFFSADYSQIELRVMAHLSGDENMIRVFREGKDLHAATAATIYKKNIDDVTRDERTKSKRANFGIIYGITVFGLAERLDISRDEAKMLIDGFFQTFPRVHDYMEQAKQTARERGYAETLFHRRRYLPDINSRNATVRNFAERNAINAPIQGSAADIIKVAMIRISERFKAEKIRSKMILQVHDELNFSVVPEEKSRVEAIVLEEMQNAFRLNVPLVADCGWGDNWLEAH
jgi:DNA polymerase-1